MAQGSGNVTAALDLLKSQRDNYNLQLQNGDLINGPGRPSRVFRNPTIDQHNAVQSAMVVSENTTLNQIRSESPVVVLNCNGISNNIQVTENKNSQAPPALPPRSSQKEPPPRIPAHPSISITPGMTNTDVQQAAIGINGHPLIGRKYSPNGTTTVNTNNSVGQNSDAPPLPPPRGAQNPPPTPPPLQPRGTTPPPAMAAAATSVTQQLNNHQGGNISYSTHF